MTIPDSPIDGAPPSQGPPQVGAAPAQSRLPGWIELRGAGIAGLLALGFALVGAVLVAIAVAVLLLISGVANGQSPPAGTPSIADLQNGSVHLGGLGPVAAVIWVALLGVVGELSGTLTVSVFGTGANFGVTANAVSLLPFVFAVAGALWWSYRSERRIRSRTLGALWLDAAVSGLVAAIVAEILGAISTVTLSLTTAVGGTASLSGFSVGTFFGPLILVGLAAAGGRGLARVPARNLWAALLRAPSLLRWGTRDLLDVLVVNAMVFGLVAVPISLLSGSAAPAAPFAIGQAGVALTTIAHFGETAYNLTAASSTNDAGYGLFSQGASGLLWLLLILTLATTAFSALLIGVRRQSAPLPVGRMWRLPVWSIAGSAVVGLLLGSAVFNASGGALGLTSGASGNVGPAPWSYLVAGVWGLVIEVLARFAVPPVLERVPALGRIRLPEDAPVAGTMTAGGLPVAGVFDPAAPLAPGLPAASAPRAPLSQRAKRRVLALSITGGALLVLVIAGVVTVSVLQNSVFSAQTAAEAYVRDVAAGRFHDAWRMESGASSSAQNQLVMSNSVTLRLSMRDVRVTEVAVAANGDREESVSYSLGGIEKTQTMTLHASGTQFLVFNDWVVTGGLESVATVNLAGGDAVDAVTVGGIRVPLNSGEASILAYPGSYALGIAPSKWMTASADPLVVDGESATAQLNLEPTSALTAEVQRQVNAVLDQCAKSTSLQPANCPFEDYEYGTVQNVAWQITQYPKVAVGDGLSAFSGDDDATSGVASVSYQVQSLFDNSWQSQQDTVPFTVEGELTITGDTVKISFQ